MGQFRAVNLTNLTGIWSMHQFHSNEGKIDKDRQRNNRVLYYEVQAGRAIACPNKQWGRLAPNIGLVVVVPVAKDKDLRRVERCFSVFRTKRYPAHVVRVVVAAAAELTNKTKVAACELSRQHDAVIHFANGNDEKSLVLSASVRACGRDVIVAHQDGSPDGVDNFLRMKGVW
jgi:hypothetical protein